MKKVLGLLMTLALTLSLTVPAFAAQLDYITDDVGLLSEEEWSALETSARELADRYACGVYAVIVEDYREFGASMEKSCNNIYQAYDLGLGADGDAIVLLLSMSGRDFWIQDYGPVVQSALTDYDRETIEEAILDDLGQDAWYDGLSDYLEETAWVLENSQDSESSPALAYGVALLVGLLAAFITCAVFKSQMKTAVRATSAEQYVASVGADLQVREDHYSHTTRRERYIQRSSGDGNSGGGGKF